MVVHCVLATVSRFCEIVNVMVTPIEIRIRNDTHPIARVTAGHCRRCFSSSW